MEERIWADVTLRLLHAIPNEPGIFLLRPERIYVGADGHIFISDWGDMTVKRFGNDGEHVATYGTGIGTAPGELMSIVDMGMIDDSLFFVVDSQSARLSVFDSNGTYIDSLSGSTDSFRHVFTNSGRSYSISRRPNPFKTSFGQESTSFGQALLSGQKWNHFMLLDGHIVAYNETMIYVPFYYPVIVQYNSAGDIIYARTTPDYGHTRPPKTTSPRPGFTGLDAEFLHALPVVEGNQISMVSRIDTTAIDVYDAPTGDYQYSIALPPWLSLMRKDRIYSKRDTTVEVYAIEWQDGERKL